MYLVVRDYASFPIDLNIKSKRAKQLSRTQQTFKPTHKQQISVLYNAGIFSFKRESFTESEELSRATAPVPTAGMYWKGTSHLENGGSCWTGTSKISHRPHLVVCPQFNICTSDVGSKSPLTVVRLYREHHVRRHFWSCVECGGERERLTEQMGTMRSTWVESKEKKKEAKGNVPRRCHI